MTNKEFKSSVNSELKHTKLTTRVLEVTEDKELHTKIILTEPINKESRLWFRNRFERAFMLDGSLSFILLHPNDECIFYNEPVLN